MNGKTVPLPGDKQPGLAMLAPFSEVDTGVKLSGKVTVEAINDWGGALDYELE